MGYNLLIGEAVIDIPDEAYGRGLGIRVDRVVLPDAPALPGDSSPIQANERWPSYSGWEDFAKQVGLYGLFFGTRSECPERRESSLMHSHPGAAMITKADLIEVTQATERWMQKPWPTKERIAGWDPKHDGWRRPPEPDQRYDNMLARLIWLKWWMRWALGNCEIPTFYNS